jgi:hypothetical protein
MSNFDLRNVALKKRGSMDKSGRKKEKISIILFIACLRLKMIKEIKVI